jgi:hypothetical protein
MSLLLTSISPAIQKRLNKLACPVVSKKAPHRIDLRFIALLGRDDGRGDANLGCLHGVSRHLRQTPRQGLDLAGMIGRRETPLREADPQRLRSADPFRAENDAQRRPAATQPRQTLRAAAPGNEAKRHFR